MSAILRGVSRDANVREALAELAEQLQPKNAHLTLLFFSPHYETTDLLESLRLHFPVRVAACSTAGEISSEGTETRSISGISFHGSDFEVELLDLEHIQGISPPMEVRLKAALERVRLSERRMGAGVGSFAMLLVDGLSNHEELLVGSLAGFLGGLPLVGGSSGDGLEFNKTYLYHDGNFISAGAILILITTRIPFACLKTQHFIESEDKIVITGSNPERRMVTEIDGEPAAKRYAEALGIQVKDFSPMVFSEHPVMLKMDGEFYVRSIQKVNSDQSLSFYCAIDDGLVLTMARKKPFIETTEHALLESTHGFSEILGSIFFECVLRRLEIETMSEEMRGRLNKIYGQFKVTGFYTYGEQFGSSHINQTLTGVIFGKRVESSGARLSS